MIKSTLPLIREYITHYVHGANMHAGSGSLPWGEVLVLIDGWHRLFAQKQLGRDAVEATIEQLSEADAQWQAANGEHSATAHGWPARVRSAGCSSCTSDKGAIALVSAA